MFVPKSYLTPSDIRILIVAKINPNQDEIAIAELTNKAKLIEQEIFLMRKKSNENELLYKLGLGQIGQKWKLVRDLTNLAKRLELAIGPNPVEITDIEDNILSLAGFSFNDGIEITEETIRFKAGQIAASVDTLYQSHLAYKFTYWMGWGQITTKLHLAYDLGIVADNIKKREEFREVEKRAKNMGMGYPKLEDYMTKTDPKDFKGTYKEAK